MASREKALKRDRNEENARKFPRRSRAARKAVRAARVALRERRWVTHYNELERRVGNSGLGDVAEAKPKKKTRRRMRRRDA